MSRTILKGVMVEIRGHKGIIKAWDADLMAIGTGLYMRNCITLVGQEYPYDEVTLKEVEPDEIRFGV